MLAFTLMQKAPPTNHGFRKPAAHSLQPIAYAAFTLLETMLVVTIVAILFVALEPTYQAFQVRAQLGDATDRTRQILEQAKTLAISGYRTPGDDPDLLVVEVNKDNPPNEAIRLCSQKFKPDDAIQPQLKPCSDSGSRIISSIPLGSIRVGSPAARTLVAFVPPFGSSVIDAGQVEIILRVGTSVTAKSSLVRLTSSTNRIEVNPPSPSP